ncbi:MAG: hypothetical protein C0483_09915 [Pirellula sp.]|nr:hypothetical protein [Pirellula sp.]
MLGTLHNLCRFFAPIFLLINSASADERLTKGIDRLVAREGITDDSPGVAILVYQPGKINFRKGYGLADLKTKTPITPRTMFELASLTKPFTATAILMMQDRGLLTIDDDVRTYLPELPEYRSGPIRIRQLLAHTSGLPEYLEMENVPARHRTYWTNEDYVGEFARQRSDYPLEFAVGQRYEYCNSNYLLAGTVIARVAKTSYGTFLRNEIFAPCGMKQSFVYESPTSAPAPPANGYHRAVGYERGKQQLWKAAWGVPPARNEETLTVGDGGIWTNLEDMAAWDAAQRAGTLLQPATNARSHQRSRSADGKQNDYGLGWELFFEDGKLIGYGHNGSWGGFRTSYYRYLKADRSTVILSNRGNFDADGFWYPLNDVIENHLDE